MTVVVSVSVNVTRESLLGPVGFASGCWVGSGAGSDDPATPSGPAIDVGVSLRVRVGRGSSSSSPKGKPSRGEVDVTAGAADEGTTVLRTVVVTVTSSMGITTSGIDDEAGSVGAGSSSCKLVVVVGVEIGVDTRALLAGALVETRGWLPRVEDDAAADEDEDDNGLSGSKVNVKVLVVLD